MRRGLVLAGLVFVFGVGAALEPEHQSAIRLALRELDDNKRVMAMQGRLQIALNANDLEGALRSCDEVIRAFPNIVSTRLQRGQILGRLKRHREAVEEYSSFILSNPDNALALNNRAYERALWGRELDEAVKDIDRAIELAGPLRDYVDTRAYLQYLLGRPADALRDFDSILGAKDPKQTAPTNGVRGVVPSNRRVPGNSAIGFQPDDASLGEIYFHRGLVYEEIGNHELARADFDKAIALRFKFNEKPLPMAKRK